MELIRNMLRRLKKKTENSFTHSSNSAFVVNAQKNCKPFPEDAKARDKSYLLEDAVTIAELLCRHEKEKCN